MKSLEMQLGVLNQSPEMMELWKVELGEERMPLLTKITDKTKITRSLSLPIKVQVEVLAIGGERLTRIQRA